MERRRKPVSGSIQTGCACRGTKAGRSDSTWANNRDKVNVNAPQSLPSTAAVGLTSLFSIRDRVARLTPLLVASSSSDHERSILSSRRRWARRASVAVAGTALCSIYGNYSYIRENGKFEIEVLKKGNEPCSPSENDQMNLPDLVALDLRLVGFLLVALAT